MTTHAGSSDDGTVYSLDPSTGVFTVLHDFSPNDGWNGQGELMFYNGLLYGSTGVGNNNGNIFSINPANGTYAVVHNFGMTASGNAQPASNLIPLQ
ncbi:MAG: hypothetical protein KGJ13_02605 [Patescibacteria group bacterium]|nr:hypothetical protein [Patescibacteria group bacterium]